MLIVFLIISIIIGSLIGWITNVLAIYLIFRPFTPTKMLLTNIHLQGLLPKRQHELAEAIGKIVEKELFSAKDIINQLDEEHIQQRIATRLKFMARERIAGRFPAFIPSALRQMILDTIEQQLEGEVVHFLRNSKDHLEDEIKESLPIATIVSEKVACLSMEELEKLVLMVAKKELKHIEYLGALLGGIIGLVQGLGFFIINSL